jgi:hypothetical protein
MDNAKRTIPKKFQNIQKSFIRKILSEEEQSPFSSFQAFPKNYNFYGKDPEEEVVIVVRAHWIYLLTYLLTIFLLIFIPFTLFLLSNQYAVLGTPLMYTGVMILSFGFIVSVIVTAIVKWYYTVTIVTDKRIIVLNVVNVFSHTYGEAQLEKIEDITTQKLGLIGTLFRAGDVHVDTAGHEVDFTIRMVPRPRDMQDVLNDLLVLKLKGKI